MSTTSQIKRSLFIGIGKMLTYVDQEYSIAVPTFSSNG